MHKAISLLYELLLAPFAILSIVSSSKIHPTYHFGVLRAINIGFRFYLNRLRIPTATNPKVHLAMALKLLELPPEEEGIVVECGTWKGGTAVNLSLICEMTGRRLFVFDSFRGLPSSSPLDREGGAYRAGDYCGTLNEVKVNLQRWGAYSSCVLIEGWFEDTLPHLNEHVVLAYVDVDLEFSLHTCVLHIWKHLTTAGHLFIDEAVGLDYCALFFSERWWKKYFDRTPPGLIGAGTGLPLGNFYIGPYSERSAHPLQHAGTGAYTSKHLSGHWPHFLD